MKGYLSSKYFFYGDLLFLARDPQCVEALEADRENRSVSLREAAMRMWSAVQTSLTARRRSTARTEREWDEADNPDGL